MLERQGGRINTALLYNRIPPFPRRLAHSYCKANAAVEKLHNEYSKPGDPDNSPTYGAYVNAHAYAHPAVHSPTLHPLAEWAWRTFARSSHVLACPSCWSVTIRRVA